jgi:uracil-DNA glycosylase
MAEWDPREDGAECDTCPLREERVGDPVPPARCTRRRKPAFLAIGQEPGKVEVSKGEPFAGPAGKELERGLYYAGLERGDLAIDNVVACMPPGKNGIQGYRLALRAKNAKLVKEHKAKLLALRAELRALPNYASMKHLERMVWLREREPAPPVLFRDPVDCCAPRLRRNIWTTSLNIVPMGSLALQCVTGNRKLGVEQAQGGWKYVTPPWFSEFVGPDEEGTPLRVLPTYNPAAILRNRSLRLLFKNHLSKAVRFFEGRLDWPEDDTQFIECNPTLDRLHYLLFGQDPAPLAWTFDWETNKDDVMLVEPKSINIGYKLPGNRPGKDLFGWRAIVLERIDVSSGRVISEYYWKIVVEYLKTAFTDGRRWYSQNGWVFDAVVAKFELGVEPANHVDVMFLHAHLFQKQRHNLNLMVTSLTDGPAYKVDEDGEGMAGTSNRKAFQDYGGRDGFSTGMVADVLLRGDESRDTPSVVQKGYFAPMPIGTGQSLAELDKWTADFCNRLHEIGIWINEPWRRRLAAWYEGVDFNLRRDINERAFALGMRPKDWKESEEEGRPQVPDEVLNPSSPPQMQHLIYDVLHGSKLPGGRIKPQEDEMTETGAPGTSSATLRRLILKAEEYGLDPRDKQLLINIYKERKINTKFLGTYLRPFGPWSEAKNKQAAYKLLKEEAKGQDLHDIPFRHPVWADGRVRGKWRPDSAVHRLKCKGAPFQVLPKGMKPVWQPAPGHAYVGCDMEQMHPRIIAGLCQAPRLIECFASGEDFYSVVAHLCDPIGWEKVCPRHGDGRVDFKTKPKPEDNKVAALMRDRWKTQILASFYDASVPTKLVQMRKAEDDAGNLVAGALNEKVLQGWDNMLLAGIPELERWWRETIQEAETNGLSTMTDPWLADPFGGRVCYFYNGLRKDMKGNDRSDAINWKVLAGESTIMHSLVQETEKRFGFGFEGEGTGIFIQVHDQVGIEIDIRGLSTCTKSHTLKGKLVPCDKAAPSDPCDTGSVSHKCRTYMHELVELQSRFRWQGIPFPAEGSWGFDLTKA